MDPSPLKRQSLTTAPIPLFPKMPKKRSNPALATAYQQDSLLDGFMEPVAPAQTPGQSSLAETLQTCYTNILDLEKKNQHHNVILNQAIFRLGQQVKQVISAIAEEEANQNGPPVIPDCFEITLGPNGELPPELRTRELRSDHYRLLLAQRHRAIQRTLVLAYLNNLELLDAYYDFVLYLLRGGGTSADGGVLARAKLLNSIFLGYQVLQVYKISRRLWIYGIINLLENMKNIIQVVLVLPPLFQDLAQAKGSAKQARANIASLDNELCANFVLHCFLLLSTLVEMNNNLTIEIDQDPGACDDAAEDIAKVHQTVLLIADFQNWWYEKIADLLRMLIALYPSTSIDWESLAEYWYLKAISGSSGHGKIYYHLATVQQPTPEKNTPWADQNVNDVSLESLFYLGKSVFARDCFVPTGHYLRLVLDQMLSNLRVLSYGLYESALLHLTCGNGTVLVDKNKVTAADNILNWELIILLYIRISRALLLNNFNSAPELVRLVSTFSRTFGSIDFIAGEDFPAFNEYSNLTGTPSATTPINSVNPVASAASPAFLDPSENERIWNPQGYAHQAIRVSFFEKDTSIGLPGAPKLVLIEKPLIKLLNFWFNKSGNLASINLWQLVGFGVLNFKNLFSILFELPVALRERQERKELKRSRKQGSESEVPESASSTMPQFSTAELELLSDDPYPLAEEMSTLKWYESLQYVNKSSLELLFRMLRKFLNCPFKSVLTPHVIVWLYFLVAVGKAARKNPLCAPVVIGLIFRRFFPWESLVNYLNFWTNEARECFDFDRLQDGFSIMEGADRSQFMFKHNLILQIQDLYSLGHEGYLNHFNENETLIEVWKLWGLLWFDTVCEKKSYLNARYAGWTGKDVLADYINRNEELLYILKPDLNLQDNMQRSHNTNNNYFRDLFSEGDGCDRTNHRINKELYECESHFARVQAVKNGTFNPSDPPPEKNDRRLFNSVEKERIKRILLLAIYIAQALPEIGLRVTDRGFKVDTSSVSQDPTANQMVFDFTTDSRLAGLAESISVGNIASEIDAPFDPKLFFRLKANYEFLMKQPQKKSRFADSEDDDRSMANLEYSKVEAGLSNRMHTDVDMDSSLIDETDSLMNYDLARKAFGVDSHLDADEPMSSSVLEPDHLISPNIGAMKVLPFDLVLATPKLDGVTVPYVSFVGNISQDIDSSISYFTFDTNSWLKNCGKIYKIFKHCTLDDKVGLKLRIALPLVVYQELRSLRKLGDSFLSDSATRCVITIKNLYNDHMTYFKQRYEGQASTMLSNHLLLLKPDGKITMNLHDSCEIRDQNLTFKAIDESILGSVSNSAKYVRQNYLMALKEKYGGELDLDSYLEFDNGAKRINGQDLNNFKFNVLISDTRPLRLKSRLVNVNAYQCKWLFYNLEKINLDGACLD